MSSSPPSNFSDEELMEAYIDGDDGAFQALFQRYGPILLRLTRRHLRDDELAEEIVQQTFFRLHGARNDFRRGSKLRPWVMTIAMNLVREHWRRTKRRKMTALEVETQAAPEADFMPLELRQRSELLHVALQKLPTSQREVVELHWFQERPYAEVAEIVGTSEGAVRVRAHRAYATLKQLLVSEIRGDE
ncbi:MAG: sigma-70 family RNA polymerase sigma factor [Myxococcales bacterium]|nr:MAG: sigma-70 family RNA polymerase sigma factor [Myxococcales bacterium]